MQDVHAHLKLLSVRVAVQDRGKAAALPLMWCRLFRESLGRETSAGRRFGRRYGRRGSVDGCSARLTRGRDEGIRHSLLNGGTAAASEPVLCALSSEWRRTRVLPAVHKHDRACNQRIPRHEQRRYRASAHTRSTAPPSHLIHTRQGKTDRQSAPSQPEPGKKERSASISRWP
jgi:hypothetical protein